MSSLRILHVVPYYEQAWAYGGIPRLATTLTHALARRGHEIAVYTTDVCDAASRALAPAVDTARPDAPRVRMFRNLSNRLAYRWQFFTPIGLAAHLRRTVRRYDVAHLHACHNLPTSVGIPLALAPRRVWKRMAKSCSSLDQDGMPTSLMFSSINLARVWL